MNLMHSNLLSTLSGIVLCLACSCSIALGQSIKAKALFTHTSLPDVSASNMLDVDNSRVIRPSSLNDITLQLNKLSGLLSGGDGGFGVELNPALLIARDKAAADIDPFLSGFTVSLAASTAGSSMRHAFGLKYTSISKEILDTNNVVSHIIAQQRINETTDDLQFSATIVNIEYTKLAEILAKKLAIPRDSVDSLLNSAGITTEGDINAFKSLIGQHPSVLARRVADTMKAWGMQPDDSFVDALRQGIEEMLGTLRRAVLPQIKKIEVNLADIQDSLAEKNWSIPGFSFGAGIVGIADSGMSGQALSTSRLDYATFYANYVGELSEGSAIVCIQLRGLWGGETVLDRRPASSFQGLAQLVFGSNIMRGLVQLSWDRLRYGAAYVGTPNAPATANNVARAEAGLECRVGSDLWLYATGGVRWTDGQAGRMITDIGVRFSPTIATATFGQLVGGR